MTGDDSQCVYLRLIDLGVPLAYSRNVADNSRVPLLVRLIWKVEQLRGRYALPAGNILGSLLFYGRPLLSNAWGVLMQALVREPALRYRCQRVGADVRLYGPGPRILGDGIIEIGDGVQFGEDMSLVVGMGLPEPARLQIGSHVTFFGHQVLVAARSISIGSYCWIGGSIYDNDAHPLDAGQRRARLAPIETIGTAPVVIEDDVWVGLNALVLKGVTLHQGAVIGAGAVVTSDVPPFAVVAGNPARVIRQLAPMPSVPAPASAAPDPHLSE
jgi:acetyltransferase-like isoleucine patch superfamily enzyme